MSYQKNSLSPAQIQFLKISPKTGISQDSKKHVIQAISEQQKRTAEQVNISVNGINKIPKLTYGQFQKTVNNFGVLLNKNFGTQTTIHQMQKFGPIAKTINKIMQQQKDKPIYNEKKNALMKKIRDRSDNRTFLKSVYDYDGQKIFIVLKSFNIQTASAHKTMDGLPIPYLKFLVSHVNSARLAKIIQGAIKNENNMIVVDYEKMQSRAIHLSNSQNKYQNIPYTFERMGQQLHITLPYLQFTHVQTNFQQSLSIQNQQILQILDCNFDNVSEIVDKYLDKQKLRQLIENYKNKGQSQQNYNQHIQREQENNQQMKFQQRGMEDDEKHIFQKEEDIIENKEDQQRQEKAQQNQEEPEAQDEQQQKQQSSKQVQQQEQNMETPQGD